MSKNMLDQIDNDISISDSDSDDYTDEIAKIDQYRENIKKTPSDYDSHIRLIKALKYSDNLLEARQARENMSEHYPLSPELWLQWINDEKSMNTDNDYINKLFIRATNDYRSADVWFEYCQFVIGHLKEISEIRQVFETAISRTGTQISNGYLIWGTYISYENTILMTCKPEETIQQIERIYKLYLRQLTLPLEGNDETMSEFLEWNKDNAQWTEEVQARFDLSKQLLEKYKPFEEKINNATVEYSTNKSDTEILSKEEGWLDYLQYGERNLSKSEMVNLFERAITDICLSGDIWVKYLRFLNREFEKDSQRLLSTYKRAVRNYKSSLELWLGLARCMEKYNCPVEDIRSIFKDVFFENLVDPNPFVPLWQAYLDFEKRQLDQQLKAANQGEAATETVDLDLGKIRQLFERLVAIDDYLFYDPQCVLIKYYAFIEAKYGKDMAKARQLWGLIIKSMGNNSSALWLENLEFERKFGDFEHVKKLAHNVVNCFPDYPEYLFDKVLRMIAEDGDLLSYLQFVKKIDIQTQKVLERRAAGERKHGEVAKNQKRKTPDTKSQDSKSKKIKTSNDVPMESPKSSAVSKEFVKVHDVEPCHEKSVFVSNLSYQVSEKDLLAKFDKCGKLVDIRMGRDLSGKSRGFAYVQFDSTEDVQAALKLEHDKLMDRPMFVSRCNPDERHSFKFAVGVLEKTKLFVKNLPKTVTKYALENVFGAYGTLKDLRIVTFKNGMPKGIAYVEFQNEDDASKALVGTDGLVIGNNTIEVNISMPPSRNLSNKDRPAEIDVSSSKFNSFIVPRAVQKPLMKKFREHEAATPDDQNPTTTTTTLAPPKSNSDFRKFL